MHCAQFQPFWTPPTRSAWKVTGGEATINAFWCSDVPTFFIGIVLTFWVPEGVLKTMVYCFVLY